MENEYNIRLYEPGDEEGIVDLYRTSFPDWSLRKDPVEYWRWKYLDSPYGSTVVVAVVDENKIIGVGSNIFLRLKLGDTVYNTTFGDDTATHPDYRGRGVYTNTVNLLWTDPTVMGNPFYYTITYNPYVLKNQIKMGNLEFPKPLVHMIHIRDLSKHLENIEIKNKTINKIGYLVFKTLNNILHNRKTPPKPDFNINDISQFGESINEFWQEIKLSYDYILEKNSTFLNWIYCSKQSGNYKIKQAVKGDKVLGFIVLEILETEGYKVGNIIELLALPTHPNVTDALISEAMMYFEAENINVVYYMTVKGHPHEKALNRFGFIERLTAEKLYLVCGFPKILHSYELIKNSDPSRLHFSVGDYL